MSHRQSQEGVLGKNKYDKIMEFQRTWLHYLHVYEDRNKIGKKTVEFKTLALKKTLKGN